jgi:hypothetical protein
MSNKRSLSICWIWSGMVTVGLWACYFLPSKLFHSDGSGFAGYVMSIAFQLLLPGSVGSLFIYGFPRPDSTGEIALSQALMIAFNWLFYFVLFAGIAKLRRRRVERARVVR